MKKHQRISVLIISAMLVFALSGCNTITALGNEAGKLEGLAAGGTGTNGAGTSASDKTVNTCGNTTGNISNGGFAAIQGNWIYYSNPQFSNWKGQGYIYKMHTNGTGETKLNEDHSSYINVVGDWVYYRNDDADGAVFKIKTDGTSKTQLNKDESDYINVIGGYIYYMDKTDGGAVHKMTADGKNEQKLIGTESSNIAVADGWVYYRNEADSGKIYKVSADGSNNTCLSKNHGGGVNIVNGIIYFCDAGGTLYSVGTDGSGEKNLCSVYSSYDSKGVKAFSGINISGDTVYYSEQLLTDYNLCKVPLNIKPGTKETTLDTDCNGGICVFGNLIYYKGLKGTYWIKTDGTGKTKVQ